MLVLVSGQYKWFRKLSLSINTTFGFILSFLEEDNVLFVDGGLRSREQPSPEAELREVKKMYESTASV